MSDLEALALRVEQLSKRKYDFQLPVASVLRAHEPRGMTGHDWDDREAFEQARALLALVPEVAAALRARAGEAK